MTWDVFLAGEESVLLALARAFDGQDPTIIRLSNGFALRATALDRLSDPEEVRTLAEGIATSLSGTAVLLLSAAGPIRVSHLEQLREDGTRNIIIQPEPATMRMSTHLGSLVVRRPDGTVCSGPKSGGSSAQVTRRSSGKRLCREGP